MVIIRANGLHRREQMEALAADIRAQAETGVIVVPSWCELLSEVPAGEEIQILQQQDDRVAELEAELRRAMFYISAQRACGTCEQYDKALAECDNICSQCLKEECFCRTCHDGSKWKWRGAHGTE